MSVTTTPNYGFKMPDGSEKIKPGDFNYNAQIIDTELYKKRVITGTTPPTTSTVGVVGQFYFDSTNVVIYICKAVAGSVYTWKPVVNEFKLLQSYTAAGSFTFTVPAGITEIGAFIIAGGGSGAACSYRIGDASYYKCTTGGGSGHTKVKRISGTLNATYPVVVGAGGVANVLGSENYQAGVNGGSSSFGGVTANGGEGGKVYTYSGYTGVGGASGGQGSSPASDTAYSTPPAFGEIRTTKQLSGNYLYSQGDCTPSECFNPFELKRGLIAGGCAKLVGTSSWSVEGTNVTDDYGLVGSVGVGVTLYGVATKGTSYGCGGGACISAGTVASAAGCDGAVLIYGR
ncbi:MAG: hypothetical protein CVU91_07495 [Firmicutes bacterium HGW-Firmicutes-16]|nr:MAG: hypothetical protein CVU91_07495 [Firmicutes bacterium HGW-Firmicutes-16]